jgi:hypothetical protein
MMTVKTDTENGSGEMCLCDLCDYCKTAHLLDDYMKFRAAKEQAVYEFDSQFFRKALDKGVCVFFGITADPDTVTLIEDTQNPAAFEEWQSRSADELIDPSDHTFTGSYAFVEAVGNAIAASPERQKLAKTLEAFEKDCPEDFDWASGVQSPALLHRLMIEIEFAARKGGTKGDIKTMQVHEDARCELTW